MRDTEMILSYSIFEITTDGHIRVGEYGYDNTFKYHSFDSIDAAVEYMGNEDTINFGHEYVILPVVEKRWARDED